MSPNCPWFNDIIKDEKPVCVVLAYSLGPQLSAVDLEQQHPDTCNFCTMANVIRGF